MSGQHDDDELTVPKGRPLPPPPGRNSGAGERRRDNRDDEEEAPRPARRSKPRAASTRARPTASLYVSPALKTRFDKYRHANPARTNTSVAFEAVTKLYSRLEDIIAASKVVTSTVDDSVFPTNPSDVRYLGGGPTPIQISATPEQLKVLDDLTDKLGFTTRATWVAPILNEFLPGRKEKAPTTEAVQLDAM